MLLWKIYVAGNSKKYIGLHVTYPVVLSDFKQIWSFWTDLHESPLY
jgi:hypothetical protein